MAISQIPGKYSEGWIETLDNRTKLAAAIRERLELLQADLGGLDRLSYQQRSLCRRAVWAEAILEQMEAALSRGEEIDLGKYTQQTNSLIGLLKTLGLERKAKDVPSLGEFLQQRAAQ